MRDVVAGYERLVTWIGQATGLTDSMLHIHAGLALMLLARLLTRRSLGSRVPLGVVAAAAVANEVMDWLKYGSWRWADTGPDLLHTLLWPVAIFLTVRLRPAKGRRR